MHSQPLDRRRFLQASVAAVLAAKGLHAESEAKQNFCVFTEPFNSLTFDELAQAIAELGFQGIEAPIRQGGHIEPEQAVDRLPDLVGALAKRNLEVTIMASDIHRADDPLTEKVLRSAAKLGVRRYRMKYLKYDENKAVSLQITEWEAQFRDLAALNRELGIRGIYQNHAGDGILGAPLWDLGQVLQSIPVEEIGVAYDIRHAAVEGGTSWPTTFRMIRPHIDSVYVKDFEWKGAESINVPLGEGRVSPTSMTLIQDSGFTGPISLHEEYLHDYRRDEVPRHLAAMKKDFSVLKQWMKV